MVELWRDEGGLTSVEYSLLLTLVGLSAILSWQGFADITVNCIEDSAGDIANAG